MRTWRSLEPRSAGPGHRRLILEELFLFQLGLARAARGGASIAEGHRLRHHRRARAKRSSAILPFHLTGAQKRVLREIADDMQSPHPMNRLVQGDVGSGKTMVALLAMVIAVENGYQAAFMAPTEILAEQHFLTFKRLLARCPYAVEAADRRPHEEGARRAAAERIASGDGADRRGDACAHPGGRALPAPRPRRGGRAAPLRRAAARRAAPKGYDVDVLVMTATPIPRTLALTAYGDLDVSVLDERRPAARRSSPAGTAPRPSARAVVDAVRRGARRAGARPTSCTRWSRSRRSSRTCARPPRWRRSGGGAARERASACCTAA